MKREQILNKAQSYLIKYSNSQSKYYNELKKNYNEYKALNSTDPVINKLYEKQILKLCRYVEEKENFWFITISLSIMIIIIVLLVSYATIRLVNSSDKVEVVMEKANSEVDLNVSVKTQQFVLHYATEDTYMNLEPLELTINPISNDNYNIVYDVYMVLDEENTVQASDIKYAVTINDETQVYNLQDCKVVIEKFLLYSHTMAMNTTEKLYLRVFTSNSEMESANFNFTLKYDGYYE